MTVICQQIMFNLYKNIQHHMVRKTTRCYHHAIIHLLVFDRITRACVCITEGFSLMSITNEILCLLFVVGKCDTIEIKESSYYIECPSQWAKFFMCS